MALSSPRFASIKRFQQAAVNNPPIGRGEVGETVRILQQSLIELGYWMDISTRRFNTPDGIFGPETEDRVKQFQRAQRIRDDGIVGKDTMAKLDALLPTAGPKLPPLPSSKTFFKYRVRIHLRSIALTEVPMSFQEQNARMVYAQYGIYLDVRSGMSLKLSPADAKKFESVDVGECVDEKLTDELGALHKLGLPPGRGRQRSRDLLRPQGHRRDGWRDQRLRGDQPGPAGGGRQLDEHEVDDGPRAGPRPARQIHSGPLDRQFEPHVRPDFRHHRQSAGLHSRAAQGDPVLTVYQRILESIARKTGHPGEQFATAGRISW
jgi:hypothetical protein